jgi:transposase-like protein
MSNIINDPVLVSAIQGLARGIKSEVNRSSLARELLKITVEAPLNAEMEAHFGYPKIRLQGKIPATVGMGQGKDSCDIDQ